MMENRPSEIITSIGPKLSMDGGKTWLAVETSMSHHDDWVETSLGWVNFGHTRMWPSPRGSVGYAKDHTLAIWTDRPVDISMQRRGKQTRLR